MWTSWYIALCPHFYKGMLASFCYVCICICVSVCLCVCKRLIDRKLLFKVKCHGWSKQCAAGLWCNCDMCQILFIIIMSGWRSINSDTKVSSSQSSFTLKFREAAHCKNTLRKERKTYWQEQTGVKRYHHQWWKKYSDYSLKQKY